MLGMALTLLVRLPSRPRSLLSCCSVRWPPQQIWTKFEDSVIQQVVKEVSYKAEGLAERRSQPKRGPLNGSIPYPCEKRRASTGCKRGELRGEGLADELTSFAHQSHFKSPVSRGLYTPWYIPYGMGGFHHPFHGFHMEHF